MRLHARADLLVCRDICVPASVTLSLGLPAGAAAPDGEAANLIDRFASRVPGDGTAIGLSVDRAGMVEADKLRVAATACSPFQAPALCVQASPGWTLRHPAIALRPRW